MADDSSIYTKSASFITKLALFVWDCMPIKGRCYLVAALHTMLSIGFREVD